VTLGGRRVSGASTPDAHRRWRGRTTRALLQLFSSTEILGRMAMQKMLAGVSTRRYPVGLEPVGERTERVATATSKSAIFRRFVAVTETALSELLGPRSVR
jgi:putative transposase